MSDKAKSPLNLDTFPPYSQLNSLLSFLNAAALLHQGIPEKSRILSLESLGGKSSAKQLSVVEKYGKGKSAYSKKDIGCLSHSTLKEVAGYRTNL